MCGEVCVNVCIHMMNGLYTVNVFMFCVKFVSGYTFVCLWVVPFLSDQVRHNKGDEAATKKQTSTATNDARDS